jgi:hypothetical protein
MQGTYGVVSVIAAVAVLAAPVEAQRRPLNQPQVRTTESVLLVGGSRLDIDELNARFDAFGYPRSDDQFLQLGFARSTVRDRLLLGLEFVGLYRPGATTADYRPQRVSFGTSGHRGTSLRRSFNDAHIAAITQAIVDYRRDANITGPLFVAIDTHALSLPALDTALQVLAVDDVHVVLDGGACTRPRRCCPTP